MTPFEMAKIYRASILTIAGSIIQYSGWSDSFAREELDNVSNILNRKDFEPIDPNEFTVDELKHLGSNRWSDELPIMLIPIWLVPYLKHGCKITCIDGTETVYDPKTIDNDHRAGLIAYGVIPKTN